MSLELLFEVLFLYIKQVRLNFFLNKSKEKGYQKAYDMCNELKELVVEYLFLKEVDSCSLRNSIFNLEDSYKNFFSKRKCEKN